MIIAYCCRFSSSRVRNHSNYYCRYTISLRLANLRSHPLLSPAQSQSKVSISLRFWSKSPPTRDEAPQASRTRRRRRRERRE